MKLDTRVKTGKKPFTMFETSEAQQYIGTRCYFADSLEDFIDFECGDLDNKIGILVDVKDNEECPFIAILDYPDMYWRLPFFFCLPCSFVQSNEPVGISDRLKKS